MCFNSFISIHSRRFIRFNSFMSFPSCQFFHFNSFMTIHSFQFMCFNSFISNHSCQLIHVNSFISCISCHFNSLLSSSPWIPIHHVSFSKLPPGHVLGTTWYKYIGYAADHDMTRAVEWLGMLEVSASSLAVLSLVRFFGTKMFGISHTPRLCSGFEVTSFTWNTVLLQNSWKLGQKGLRPSLSSTCPLDKQPLSSHAVRCCQKSPWWQLEPDYSKFASWKVHSCSFGCRCGGSCLGSGSGAMATQRLELKCRRSFSCSIQTIFFSSWFLGPSVAFSGLQWPSVKIGGSVQSFTNTLGDILYRFVQIGTVNCNHPRSWRASVLPA